MNEWIKTFLFVLAAVVLFSTIDVNASLNVEYRDMKLATQVLLEKQTLTDASLRGAFNVLNSTATSASATTTVTSFLNQPDVCRTLLITPGGTTADVAAGNITVSGYDVNGAAYSELVPMLANQSTEQQTVGAFCSVTSIVFPIQDGAAATYRVGFGDKFGFKKCMDKSTDVFKIVFGSSNYTGSSKISVDASVAAKNLIEFTAATNDSSSDVELYFIQNFRCLP